jgi:hypothetical protein
MQLNYGKVMERKLFSACLGNESIEWYSCRSLAPCKKIYFDWESFINKTKKQIYATDNIKEMGQRVKKTISKKDLIDYIIYI